MLTTFCRVILALAHILYVVFAFTKSQLIAARYFIRWPLSFEDRPSRANITSQEYRVLEHKLGTIKKLPGHLCVVLESEERISFIHLARILGWCIILKIPYVSFYDHDGFLKENQHVFRAECERTLPKLVDLIDWECRTTNNQRTNGLKPGTRVQIFSNEDGKGEIVTLAQNLSRAVVHGLLKMEEIDTDLLDDKLRLDNMPDPDLVFVCSPVLSTYGLLPWHTRTTEFFNVKSPPDITINDFTFLLEKYSVCQQRYGK